MAGKKSERHVGEHQLFVDSSACEKNQVSHCVSKVAISIRLPFFETICDRFHWKKGYLSFSFKSPCGSLSKFSIWKKLQPTIFSPQSSSGKSSAKVIPVQAAGKLSRKSRARRDPPANQRWSNGSRRFYTGCMWISLIYLESL